MIDPARALYDSLDGWPALERLIDNAESEGPYLECKAVAEPRLQSGQRTHLAQALSGFSNTMGGVLIWGISTTKHAHTNLDILSQLEPVGNCRSLLQQIVVASSTLAYPAVVGCETKALHPTPGATKGIVVTYVPKSSGDPVQSLADKRFYLRSGDDFVEMPYDILKKMFAATAGPDVQPVFDPRIVQRAGNVWKIPIVLSNGSSAAASVTKVVVWVLNISACEKVEAQGGFYDTSEVNPGHSVYSTTVNEPIFRGLSFVPGHFLVTMKKGKRPRRILNLRIEVFASGMRGRRWTMAIQLANRGFSVKKTHDTFIY